jgi:predicted RNA binding protein YcfA (HicA-like mRNA interferase family)/predicted RNase H-like HicB family nuclease
MKVRDVLKVLAGDGWKLKSQEGSHRHFVHPTKSGKVTVPGHPALEVPAGTLSSILKQAGPEKMRYPVIYEKSANGWGAYIPDLPGCVALGFTLDETKRLIRESLEIHLRSMREDGDPIPEPSHVVDVLEVVNSYAIRALEVSLILEARHLRSSSLH